MDTGRNEPCPCGSGKKYKRCCGAPKTDPMEFAAGVIRAAESTAEPKMMRLLKAEFGNGVLEDAWVDFDLTDGQLEPGREEAQHFFTWLLYDWEPWDDDLAAPPPSPVRESPALAYCDMHRGDFTDAEHAFITNVANSPMSFHEVTTSEPGRTLTLRDILVGSEVTVFDRNASSSVNPGDILYARIVSFDDVALLVGCGDLVLPPSVKLSLLDLRADIKKEFRTLSPISIWLAEPTLRMVYFDLRDRIINPARPQMTNTDGHPMEFHTLTYRIEDPEATLRALAPLAHGQNPDDIVSAARRDWRGTLRSASFPWSRAGSKAHGGASNTTLADFSINGETLTVHVNSAVRAKAVRDEIAVRIGMRATFVRDDVETLDAAPPERRSKREMARERVARQRDEELQALPEVQAMLSKMNADHYATWADVPLPALKGKTPRAAMKTRDGRERVEALVADFERSQDSGRVGTPHYDFNQLREMLGLPSRKA